MARTRADNNTLRMSRCTDIFWRLVWRWPVLAWTVLLGLYLVVTTLVLPEWLARIASAGDMKSGWSAAAQALESWHGTAISLRPARFLLYLSAGLAIMRITARCTPPWLRPGESLVSTTLALSPGSDEQSKPPDPTQMLEQTLLRHGSATHALGGGVVLARRPVWVSVVLASLLDVAFILLVIASQAQAVGAWRGEPTSFVLGQSAILASEAHAQATLKEIEISSAAGPSSVASLFSIESPESSPTEVLLATGQRRRMQGIYLHQTEQGPAIYVRASDDAGPLSLQAMTDSGSGSALRLAFGEDQREHVYAIPSRNLILRMVFYDHHPQFPEHQGVLQIQGIHGQDGHQLFEQFLTESGQIAVDGISLWIQFEYFVVLLAHYEPQYALSILALLIGLVGALSLLIWPPRTFWVVGPDDALGIDYASIHTRPRTLEAIQSSSLGDALGIAKADSESAIDQRGR